MPCYLIRYSIDNNDIYLLKETIKGCKYKLSTDRQKKGGGGTVNREDYYMGLPKDLSSNISKNRFRLELI